MKKYFLIIVLMLLMSALVFAEQPRDMTGLPNGIWVAPQTVTASNADGAGDVYINGVLEVNGTLYAPKTFDLPLVGAFLDGTGVMGNDGTTAPGMAEVDNVPAIVWASSAEQVKCQWTIRVPDDYISGLGFRILMSSSAATSTGQSIDWQFWVNDDDTTFDAAAISQDAVAPTSSTLNASNEVVTLTIDATGEAAISAGSFLTIDIWNAGTSDNTTEIKGIQGYYNE